ncbi:hypothetical protein [Pseudomonas oryzihabitans]|uniref:hypothetical protein n=1 Tax=Pseudomonas oryzihabitans TaxID=47885 RepID=UPI00289D2FE1|nr:hypothetical protein [Pseudomonas oryzihabitans]
MITQQTSLRIAAMQLLIALTPCGWLPFLMVDRRGGPAIQAVFVDAENEIQDSVEAETLEELEDVLFARRRVLRNQEAA